MALRDWLTAAAGRPRLAAAATAWRPRSTKAEGRVCLLTWRQPQQQRREWRAWHRLCMVGHLPPSWTHALVTNPRRGQTRDRCTRRMFLGEVTGVRGANVGSREMTATAAVGPQCWAMRGVSVIGSRLKSTKLPELYRIVPADSLPRPPPPPVMWLMLMVTGLAAQLLACLKRHYSASFSPPFFKTDRKICTVHVCLVMVRRKYYTTMANVCCFLKFWLQADW